jgi:hypothetical protein
VPNRSLPHKARASEVGSAVDPLRGDEGSKAEHGNAAVEELCARVEGSNTLVQLSTLEDGDLDTPGRQPPVSPQVLLTSQRYVHCHKYPADSDS